MTSDVGNILPLPLEVAAQIESATVITSVADVVVGLVENSLDACATRMDVKIDFARGLCVVEDDGHGIAPGDFKEDGGLGKSCCMSGKKHGVHNSSQF